MAKVASKKRGLNQCPRCGTILTLAEVDAAKRAGLPRGVCTQCLAWVLKWLKDELLPFCEKALEHLDGDGHER